MILAAHSTGPEERRSAVWLLGTVVILTMGELYLSPIGLSLVTNVAPARIVSMMLGISLHAETVAGVNGLPD
ncbi:MAG: hypothetical protein ABSG91_22985 [Syntrophobacteraceae bacterium]|jgi:POT family proton-dependent oligopeptide transporter